MIERQAKPARKKAPAIRRLQFFCLYVFLALCCASCADQDPEHARQAAVAATVTKLRGCAQQTMGSGTVRLAIAEITRQPEETTVRLVAYTVGEAADFNLPVYLMSRGRWLINEKGRAYLLDEHCREYKLKDRRSASGTALPLDGKIALQAGTAFELKLSFPVLPSGMHLGMLIYDSQALSFTLPPAR